MKEREWASLIANKIHDSLKVRDERLSADVSQKLIYKNEIVEYTNGNPIHNCVSYETDILVYEWSDIGEEKWKPRVVIETKVSSITSHDAITYSRKSHDHKAIHPYLRYGIFIGNLGECHIPGRLIRHGENFDFMISWRNYDPSKIEWDSFMAIINAEVDASRNLEKIVFGTRNKAREKIFILHRPLVTVSILGGNE